MCQFSILLNIHFIVSVRLKRHKFSRNINSGNKYSWNVFISMNIESVVFQTIFSSHLILSECRVTDLYTLNIIFCQNSQMLFFYLFHTRACVSCMNTMQKSKENEKQQITVRERKILLKKSFLQTYSSSNMLE